MTKGTGTIRLTGNSTQAAELRFYEDTDDGTNYTSFKVGTQAGDVAYTLPTAYPASNGYVLASTTAGVMSWVSAPTGTAVDTIYRTPGKDSIQFTISGRYYAIKDSVGSVAGLAWSLTGNNPTAGWTEGNFLGTTSNKSLLVRTNNIMRMRVDSAGSAGTLRIYPGNVTSAYIDYGTAAANKWTFAASGFEFNPSSGFNITSNSVGTMAAYNGEVVVGSLSASGTTKLKIDNANTTKSVMNWSSTTKKTTAADGDWTRDANGVYYGKSTTWNEILMTASVNTVSPTSPNRTITVVIGGTTYYIAAKTTND